MFRRSENPKRLRLNSVNWTFRYTLLYLIVALALAMYFLGTGNSMVFSGDGFYQHYTILAHIRNAFRNLLAGEGFDMVSFQIGQGLDTITTLASHGFLNPLYWIAALFTEAGLETVYALLIFIQFYLIGLLFCIFLRQFAPFRRQGVWAAPVAGLIFAFCGYNLVSVLRHPYFADGAIYLALMLIGVERLLQKKKWCGLSIATAVMLISNYYFAYKTALLTAIYILIRILPHLRKERGGVKRVLCEGFKLLGACALGALLSAVVLLPVGIAYLGSSRGAVYGGYSGSLLHYDLLYYAKIFLGFCAPGFGAGCWTFMGFCPLVLIALMDLCASRRECAAIQQQKTLRNGICAAVLLTGLFLCVPLWGKIFNGMSYVTNRWSYAFSFAVSAATGFWLLRFENGENTLRKSAGVVMLIYALVVAVSMAIPGISMLLDVAFVVLFGVFCIVCSRRICWKRERVAQVCALLTALCCAVYAVVTSATQKGFFEQGVLEQVLSGPAGQAELPNQGFYRLDTGLDPDNHAVLLDYHGTGFYWSIIPAHVSQYYQNLQVGTLAFSYRLNSLGGDSTLLALAGAKYSVRQTPRYDFVIPYGAEIVSDTENTQLYRNPYALDLGYTYHAQLTETEYAALDPVQKRMALISCAVIPDDVQSDMPAYRNDFTCEKAEWVCVSADGAVLTDNTLSGKAGDSVTLQFERRDGSESYLSFERCEAVSAAGQVAALDALTSAGMNRMAFTKKSSNFYFEQQGVFANLGSGNARTDTVTLRFLEDGAIRFSDLCIYNLPMQAYCEQIQKLNSESMADAQLGHNRVSGSVTLASDGILQIAVPYGKGWTARVDGSEAELMRCGGMYMGVALKAGTHHVELSYCTPGLKAGAAISAMALAALLALGMGSRLKKRKESA